MRQHPNWLRQTKRLFPNRLFAAVVSFASLLVGILLAGVALNVQGAGIMGVPSILFFLGSLATACAATVPPDEVASRSSSNAQTGKPTFAILVLLISVYSWLLTAAMHIFHTFFKNGPGTTKYYVTLGIALTSTLFMKLYGGQIVRKHFGKLGGRNLELDTAQAIYVTLFVVAVGIYTTWLTG